MTKSELEHVIREKDKTIEERQGIINAQIEIINELHEENSNLLNQAEEDRKYNMTYNHDYSYQKGLEYQITNLNKDIESKDREIHYLKESSLLDENRKLKDHIIKLSMKVQ